MYLVPRLFSAAGKSWEVWGRGYGVAVVNQARKVVVGWYGVRIPPLEFFFFCYVMLSYSLIIH